MFKKILIANRGEIALRIIRTCRVMGIQTVAIYSPSDKNMLHVQLADESYCVGSNDSKNSYLNIFSILSAACLSGADAIHPGYGFLSENEDFQKACQYAGIKFIGPDEHSFGILADKSSAKQFLKSHDIPTIPGSDGNVKSLEDALKIADEIGYPLLLKAAYGGGGRGIRKVEDDEQLRKEYPLVSKEAMLSFGKSEIYMEKFIANPHHIEVQILRDYFGNAVSLHERECSLQRKNQKILEESPSPHVSPSLREKLNTCAIKIAHITEYVNAGTIEFLLDDEENFYFMEMNTRIQVEHPVTEMITGIDIVREQIRIANNQTLSIKQEDVKILGHSIEIRVNAEDVKNNFMPSTGHIRYLHTPSGHHVRFDSFLTQDSTVSPFYDSMLAKIIVLGSNRLEAIRRARAAIEETIIEGVKTNLAFQYTLLHDSDFIKAKVDTNFVERKLEELLERIMI